MFERTTESGSVWVTLKHSSDKSKVKRNKLRSAGENIEFKCLIRATDGKKTISTMVYTILSFRFILTLFATYSLGEYQRTVNWGIINLQQWVDHIVSVIM